MTKKHYSLIGMSGIGKSLFGNALAKELDLAFIDTDDIIQEAATSKLKDYIAIHGDKAFKQIEEDCVCNLNLETATIISTGGSVIYSEKSMAHLKAISTIIFLQDSFENIRSRLPNYEERGIVMNGCETLEDVYKQRLPLYKHYADKIVTYPQDFSIQTILSAIKKVL